MATGQIISDDDGIYYARAWRSAAGKIDENFKKDLFAWARSMPPSRLLMILSVTHTYAEALELLVAIRPEVTDG